MIPKIEISLPDFSDPEVFRSLEKQSYTGTLDYTDFPPVEYQYFAELRKIYYAFKFEDLGKSEAEQRKKHLRSRYESEKYKASFPGRQFRNGTNASGSPISSGVRFLNRPILWGNTGLPCSASAQ